jgi:hypothetical protein
MLGHRLILLAWLSSHDIFDNSAPSLAGSALRVGGCVVVVLVVLGVPYALQVPRMFLIVVAMDSCCFSVVVPLCQVSAVSSWSVDSPGEDLDCSSLDSRT